MKSNESSQTAVIIDGQSHTSALLQELINGISEDHFTLDWLMGHLPKNSFGIILLFLALLSLLPIISFVARLLILVLLLQILLGYTSPVLPQRFLLRPLPSHYLSRLDRHAIPALKHLEKAVRPRWPTFLLAARRVTAVTMLLLTILSLVLPIPLANVPVAIISMVIALAYIEHDGLLLAIGLGSAFAVLAVTGIAIHELSLQHYG
jgi:hypothetical protein